MSQSCWSLLALTLWIFISVEDLVDQAGLACRCFLAVLVVPLDQVDQQSRPEVRAWLSLAQAAPVLEPESWARVPVSEELLELALGPWMVPVSEELLELALEAMLLVLALLAPAAVLD